MIISNREGKILIVVFNSDLSEYEQQSIFLLLQVYTSREFFCLQIFVKKKRSFIFFFRKFIIIINHFFFYCEWCNFVLVQKTKRNRSEFIRFDSSNICRSKERKWTMVKCNLIQVSSNKGTGSAESIDPC